MKPERSILTAFLLNLAFSVFECAGGILTGSVAILSDAVHDLGDALGIGLSWALERKSRRPPDQTCTYGYARYSVLGSVLTSGILLLGSAAVLCRAAANLAAPPEIDSNGMILFALVGVAVNGAAAWFTRGGDSLNLRAVSLHMLEDVLGWAVVLAGALVMRWTDFSLIDPILSMAVAGFILVNALRNLKEAVDVLLEKVPHGVDAEALGEHLRHLEGILEVHHLHVWSLDGQRHCATMHIVTNDDPRAVRAAVREELREHGIGHAVLELETEGEGCSEPECMPAAVPVSGCGHHGHPHHHSHGHGGHRHHH